MAIADRIEIRDIVNLYEFGEAGTWKNCILLSMPGPIMSCWVVRNEAGRVLYVPASKVVVELRAKSVA